MKIFKVNDRIEIVCSSESTRYGFRHLATMLINGVEHAKGKCCYYNRTWESYQFQSVLSNVVRKADLSPQDRQICEDFVRNGRSNDDSLKSTLMVAKLGDIFCNTQKEKNDWKLRMLKAGLENKGLSIPADWDNLSEADKEARLNAVLQVA